MIIQSFLKRESRAALISRLPPTSAATAAPMNRPEIGSPQPYFETMPAA